MVFTATLGHFYKTRRGVSHQKHYEIAITTLSIKTLKGAHINELSLDIVFHHRCTKWQ